MQGIIVEVAMFKLNKGVTDQAFIAEAYWLQVKQISDLSRANPRVNCGRI